MTNAQEPIINDKPRYKYALNKYANSKTEVSELFDNAELAVKKGLEFLMTIEGDYAEIRITKILRKI